VYRDPIGWYHVVVATDTTQASASNRMRVYINGAEITSWATDNRASLLLLNGDLAINTAAAHNIGRDANSGTFHFDGYMADVHFIDGQALTPSSFGQTDPTTGSWVPRRYTGTYGTNGFYLPFNDAASTTTISQDRSGNGNNWTSSGISVTSGVTFDQMLDSPTNNYATLNPLDCQGSGATATGANLNFSLTNQSITGTVRLSSGKWYFEVEKTSASQDNQFGISGTQYFQGAVAVGTAPGRRCWRDNVGSTAWLTDDATPGAGTPTGLSNGDRLAVALDLDNLAVYFGRIPSGSSTVTWMNSGVPTSGASKTGAIWTDLGNAQSWAVHVGGNANGAVGSLNHGQRPFAISAVPTGFVALNTANLSTPTIQNGASAFQATLRTGTGASASVSSLRFQPAIAFIKSRSNATQWNFFDEARGATKAWTSGGGAEYTDANTLTAFNANGYSLGTDGSSRGVNINANTYVDFLFRGGAAYGVQALTYTGTGVAGRTVAHSLNAVPHMIIVKQLNVTNWTPVYHRNANANPQSGSLPFSSTGAFFTDNSWNNTAPTSSVFTVGGASLLVNDNGVAYGAWLFTSIPGFSLFGSYTGNGSADGPFVWCGFRPRFVMIKPATAAESWYIVDAARNTFNVTDSRLVAEGSGAEVATGMPVDFTANGFKLRTANGNPSGGTVIFAAFAEHPFKFANAR
jgi:hypothetical protein